MRNQPLTFAIAVVLAACTPAPGSGPVRSEIRDPPAYAAGGTVIGVERGSPTDPATHVHLVVQPGEGTPVRVDLGPGWYLDEHGLRFSKGDRMEIEGRTEKRPEGNVIVARRVRKDGKTVELGAEERPTP